jgi:hypothetical protein
VNAKGDESVPARWMVWRVRTEKIEYEGYEDGQHDRLGRYDGHCTVLKKVKARRLGKAQRMFDLKQRKVEGCVLDHQRVAPIRLSHTRSPGQ